MADGAGKEAFAPLYQMAVQPETTYELGDDGELHEVPVNPEQAMAPPLPEDEWYENLAEHPDADESKLSQIASDIIELVRDDIASRDGWTKLLVRGLELMGLKKSDIDDGPFPGAATVVHPVLTEAVVQFWARALPELFPSDGPAKGKVRGKQTEERLASAERVQDHMNYQMLEEDRGYRRETSRMLFAVGAHGGAYRKTFRNTVADTTQGIYVPAEHFIVPYSATALETAPRFTHRMRKTPNEIKKAQRNGEYRKCELIAPSDDEETEAETAKAEVEAKTPTGNEKDAHHEIFETYIDYDVPWDRHRDPEIELPYIVSIETGSNKVMAIRRNWRKEDEMREKRIYFTPFEFIPGFGFYPLGLFHLIGCLSESATGALRAILDGAATASLQGGFITKDVAGKLGSDDGSALIVEPGKWKPIDASSDELAKGIYTPPFKEPATVLYQVLGFLVESARKVASTTETLTGEGDNTGPVGTTVALIEQGMKVFSTVHQGLHISMGHELRVRFEINREYAPLDGYAYDVHGDEREVAREDYWSHSTDIVPVSDPNIFSVTQRLAIAQATYQLSQENPDIYNKIKVHKRLHEAMKTPSYEELLIDPQDMIPLDPIAENQCLLTMQPIRVFPEQDHASHIAVHMAFMQNPGYGGHPEVFEMIQGAAKAHIAQHLAALHAAQVASLGVPVGTINFAPETPREIGTPEQSQVAAMAAQIAAQIATSPGLPPPPEAPEQAQHEQEMRFAEETHQQGLKHKDEAHAQELQHKEADFGLDTKIKEAERVQELEQKDEAFITDQARKEMSEERDRGRKDEVHDQGMRHKDADKAQAMVHKEVETEQNLEQKAREAKQREKDAAKRKPAKS